MLSNQNKSIKSTIIGPIDPDGELAEPEHWLALSLSKGETLLISIYGYFIKNPIFLEFNMIFSN